MSQQDHVYISQTCNDNYCHCMSLLKVEESCNQVLTVHVTCTDVELRTTGLCMLTTTSPNSFCTRRWSTPCAVGLMSGRENKMVCRWGGRDAYQRAFFAIHFCTLRADRLRHGTGVPEPLSIDCPDDEQVDCIGP